MFHKTNYKITKSIYLIILSISILNIISLLYFNYFTYCSKYVIWNEVIFLSLLYSFSINICLYNLSDDKNWSKEYSIAKHSVYIIFSISFYSLAFLFSLINITKLTTC